MLSIDHMDLIHMHCLFSHLGEHNWREGFVIRGFDLRRPWLWCDPGASDNKIEGHITDQPVRPRVLVDVKPYLLGGWGMNGPGISTTQMQT